MDDVFGLARFVQAQDDVFAAVTAELTAGRKASHWMWFVFPQIAGLGMSPMARRFAISGLPEAGAYLDHEILGPRLRRCTDLVIAVDGRSIGMIFGQPDDMKFRSSMTLFAEVDPKHEVFRLALERYFGGEPDPATLARL